MSMAPLFTINGLSHSFGGLQAVANFNIEVQEAQVWGIIGPNGAGKTTVFNLITGVYKPDKGGVFLDNKRLTGLPSHKIIGSGISRTFQNIRLFKSMTVLDNIRTAGYCRLDYMFLSVLFRTRKFKSMESEIREKAVLLLDKFGLLDRINEPAGSLPYGLQRKVEIARALLSGPKVLLLDEPGAGMNPAELDNLIALIKWVAKEFSVSILLIEHRMQLVMQLCDYVKVIDFGKTIFTGKPGDLKSDSSVLKAYFGEEHETTLN